MDEKGAHRYVWTGRGGPFELMLTREVFAPTHTSREMAEGLVVNPGDVVIDVGAGSGVLSFVAARLGAARVYGSEGNWPAGSGGQPNTGRRGLPKRDEFMEMIMRGSLAGHPVSHGYE